MSVQCAITAVRTNRTYWDRTFLRDGVAAEGSGLVIGPRVGLLRLSRLLAEVTA